MHALRVEPWCVPAFSEEVIRGGPAFAAALLLRHLDPMLRTAAGLGGWQIISPGRAAAAFAWWIGSWTCRARRSRKPR